MRFLIAILSLFAAASGFSGKFVQCEQPSRAINTIAHRLAGTWVYSQALSDNLGRSSSNTQKFRFTEDPSALAQFPEFNGLENFCVYFVGTMDWYGENNREATGRPFVLTTIGGMPYIVWVKA